MPQSDPHTAATHTYPILCSLLIIHLSSVSITMATQSPIKLPSWSRYWLSIGSLLTLIDAAFIFTRPASLKGGSLHHFFFPYEWYIRYDPVYGDMDDAFSKAQSYMNIVEVALLFVGLIIYHSHRSSSTGAYIIMMASTATLFKTFLYLLYDFSDSNSASHYHLTQPSTWDLGYIGVFFIPTSFWVTCPIGLMYDLGKQFIRAADQAGTSQGGKKKQ